MAIRRRRAPRRKTRAPRRKAVRKTRVPRNRLFATNQMALIKETRPYSTITGNSAVSFVFSLNQFQRALLLAPNFKWYKAKLVEWTIEPLFNTFTDDGSPQSVPYTYMAMNRTQDNVPMVLGDFQAMGCKPQKLISKRVIKYRPNWCSPGLLSYTLVDNAVQQLYQNGLKPQYGYLACPNDEAVSGSLIDPIVTPTNPLVPTSIDVIANQVLYNGHEMYFDQLLAGEVPCARVTCTVTWEFKDPHFTRSA